MTKFTSDDLRQLEELQRKRDIAQAEADRLFPLLDDALLYALGSFPAGWDGWPGTRPLARQLAQALTGVPPTTPNPMAEALTGVKLGNNRSAVFFQLDPESLEQPDPEARFG